MHIKKVKIKNYKSYKDVVIDDLSCGLNVIVGQNGSGKSNFLSAIQCVLNPETYYLRSDDKFHQINDEEESLEGYATIDVVFDNKSRRFPVQKDEVTLSRVLSPKKDSYMVDQRQISKQEMLNLLESVGFSKCNPYNVVRQGKVHELAISTDTERYNLLLDIAGVKVYDERRNESLNVLEMARDKKTQILSKIKEMEERLNSLETEKIEIIDHNKKEIEKKKIEYLIYKHDKESYNSRMEQLNVEKQVFLEKLDELEKKITSERELIQDYSEKMKDKTNKILKLESEYTEDLEKLNKLFESKSRIEIEIHDLKSSNLESTHQKIKYEESLEQIKNEILFREEELKNQKHKLNKIKLLETTIREHFRSNSWNISQEISFGECFNSKMETEYSSEEINKLKEKSEELNKKIDVYREEIKVFSDRIEIYKEKQLDIINKKKNLWSKESEISNEINILNQKLSGFDKKWNQIISRDILDGLKSLKSICKEESIQGVFGPLFENFEIDSRYYVAINVTAGNKIFNILVDTSKTATNILKKFKEKSLEGHVTFMPIDNLKFKKIDFKKFSDAIPLIDKLKYDSKFETAFQLIFGSTYLCKNKNVAFEISRENKIDGVTLEGDQVFYRGSIIGGYIDSHFNILELYKNIKEINDSINGKNFMLVEIKQEIDKYNKKINKIVSLSTKDQLKMNESRSQLKKVQEQLFSINTSISNAEINKPDIFAYSKDSTQSQILDESFTDCSNEELEEKLKTALFENTKIISHINSIESTLINHYYMMRNDLINKIGDLKDTGIDHIFKMKNNDLSNTQNNINSLNNQINDIQNTLQRLKGELIQIESTILQHKDILNKYNTDHSRNLGELDGHTNKILLMKKKVDEAETHIKLLGISSDENFSNISNKSIKWLWKHLNTFESQLQKSNINKKAAEDFINLSSQRDKTVRNYEEFDRSLNSINDLIEKLDKRKNETIMFTFKQVSYYFTNIFSQLLPDAQANLVLRRNPLRNIDDNAQENIVSYSAVGIKISFDKDNKNIFEIGQLSGGQKSLITLALIFAFQKCDPVPFYLFDEVDQALDPVHRQTFCKMLHELSQNGQFIVTTFRPEILAYDPKCFHVTYKNRVSSIKSISTKTAKSKVESSEIENN